MIPEPHYLKVEKTARFYTSGPLSDKYRVLCFALHGYGQLAPYFIRSFEQAGLTDVLFVAPEGLHRFYTDEAHQRVGASWMTREDRLTDIDDYCRYLDTVYQKVTDQNPHFKKVGVLGFSQGVATASRWFVTSGNRFDFVMNYAGTLPPDLPVDEARQKYPATQLFFAAGNEDPFIKRQQAETEIRRLKDTGTTPEVLKFKGRHKIYPAVVRELFNRMM